jgi:hypothetical protein
VLGWRSSSDPTTYAIFDAHTGGRITLLDTLGADLHVLQVAWDGADTVLVVATDGKHEAIVRLDRQGHATLATPIRTVTGSRSGYRLASRP